MWPLWDTDTYRTAIEKYKGTGIALIWVGTIYFLAWLNKKFGDKK